MAEEKAGATKEGEEESGLVRRAWSAAVRALSWTTSDAGAAGAPRAASGPVGPLCLLDELRCMWQPMVAMPRVLLGGESDRAPRGRSAPKRESDAWCIIDLDSCTLSCESRGLRWDPFEIVREGDDPPSAGGYGWCRWMSASPASSSSSSSSVSPSSVASCERPERVLLRSTARSRRDSWLCEIVRGPPPRARRSRVVYYADLTFSDTSVEPHRGLITGGRMRLLWPSATTVPNRSTPGPPI
jgi:hypothetical protein